MKPSQLFKVFYWVFVSSNEN